MKHDNLRENKKLQNDLRAHLALNRQKAQKAKAETLHRIEQAVAIFLDHTAHRCPAL
jgi:hypothetical protein